MSLGGKIDVRGIRFYLLGIVLVTASIGAQSCVERGSVGSGGLEGNSHAYAPALSADGRWIAFVSESSTLVPGDTNIVADIFVRDRRSDTTTRVSVASSGSQMSPWLAGGLSPVGCAAPSLSADGRFVAFASFGADLVPGDTNGKQDVFVHDRLTGTTERVSVSSFGVESDADAYLPMISGDGTRVVWQSTASTLVVGDMNGLMDVFLHDRTTGSTSRVSKSASGGDPNGASSGASISANGSRVAFTSTASNLVTGDTNAAPDVFLADLATWALTRASVAGAGTQATGSASGSGDAFISADGLSVAFRSHATNLVTGDSNGFADVFVRRLALGTTTRVSMTQAGGQAAGTSASGAAGSFVPRLSEDGRYVAFVSHATNLVNGDTNGFPDVFLRDTVAATTLRLGIDARGAGVPTGTGWWGSTLFVALSSDGSTVAFPSSSSTLLDGDGNGACDVFVNTAKPRLSAASSVAKGAALVFTIDGPADAAGSPYVLALSGATTPAIPLGAGRVLPLADDGILAASLTPGLSALVGFQGILGGLGTASATLNVPNVAALSGLTFHAAFVVIDGGFAFGVRGLSTAHAFTVTN